MSDAPGTELTRRMERDFEEEFLTCSLCSEAYDHEQHIAKYLPCLHTFCKCCLVAYLGNKRECLCPLCRKRSLVPETGVEGIPNNFTVENLKEYHAIFRSEPGQKHGLQCTSCEDGLDATSFCHDCGYFLCNGCTDAHRRMRQLKGHALSSITELQQKMRGPNPLRKERCDQHTGQELSLYCVKCGVAVCNTCAIAGHERSEGHVMINLDDEVENAKGELREKAQQVRTHEEPVARLSGQIDSQINDLSAACTKVEKDICEHFRKLQSSLDRRRDVAISDLRQMCQEKAKNLREQKDVVESLTTQITSACEFAERACTSANPSQLLGARIQVLQRLQELSENATKPSLTLEADLALTFHESHFKAVDDVEKAASNLGTMMTSSINPSGGIICGLRLHEPIIALAKCRATITTVDIKGKGHTFAASGSNSGVFAATITSHAQDIAGDNATSTCQVTENGDGTYNIDFIPFAAGMHTMIVKLDGDEITESPLNFVAKASVFRAYVTWKSAFPDVPHTIVVDIQDNVDSSNSVSGITSESVSATVSTSDGREIPHRISQKTAGKFFIKYTPIASGDIAIAVALNGREIEGSPFTIHVVDVSPASTTVSWDPHPVANQIWCLRIATKTVDGTMLTTGGHNIVVRLTDQSTARELPYKMIDNKNGSYTVSCIPRNAAVHMIRVTLDNVLLGNGLYEVRVAGSKALGKPGQFKIACLAIDKLHRQVCLVDTKTDSVLTPDDEWEQTQFLRKLDPACVPGSRIAFDNKGRLIILTPHTRCVYIKQGVTTDMWVIPSAVIHPITLSTTSSCDIILGDSQSNALFVLSISGSLIKMIPLSHGCMTGGVNNVCVDDKDNMYICHADNSIFRIDSGGNTSRVLQMVGKNKVWLAIAITPDNILLISQRHGNILVVDMGGERPVFRQEIQTDGVAFDFHTIALDPIGGYALALDADGKRVVKYGYRGCLPGDFIMRKKRASAPPSPKTKASASSAAATISRHRPSSGLNVVEDVF